MSGYLSPQTQQFPQRLIPDLHLIYQVVCWNLCEFSMEIPLKIKYTKFSELSTTIYTQHYIKNAVHVIKERYEYLVYFWQ